MQYFKKVKFFVTIFLMGIVGCGQDLPFEYEYKSKSEVDLTYNGVTYELSQDSKRSDTPFSYEFESDGDLDVIINGRRYEIDSPYDLDNKKIVKKSSTKKSTRKTKSRQRR